MFRHFSEWATRMGKSRHVEKLPVLRPLPEIHFSLGSTRNLLPATLSLSLSLSLWNKNLSFEEMKSISLYKREDNPQCFIFVWHRGKVACVLVWFNSTFLRCSLPLWLSRCRPRSESNRNEGVLASTRLASDFSFFFFFSRVRQTLLFIAVVTFALCLTQEIKWKLRVKINVAEAWVELQCSRILS